MKARSLFNKTARLDSPGSFKVGFSNICWEGGGGFTLERHGVVMRDHKKMNTRNCVLMDHIY